MPAGLTDNIIKYKSLLFWYSAVLVTGGFFKMHL